MKTKGSRRGNRLDVFVSHASKDAVNASQLVKFLVNDKLKVWIDDKSLKFGVLLRNELQTAIRNSRVLVLLWSKAALKSRWVMAEMFTAFHLGRFIVPCVLDETPLPQFLQNSAYLDFSRQKATIGEKLCRAVRTAPKGANDLPIFVAAQNSIVQSLSNAVAAGQYGVLAAMENHFDEAVKANKSVNSALKNLQAMAPLDPKVLNLAGYQCKNNYMFKHWDAVNAWRAPKDPLLERGERYFFETLCVDPLDMSSINGLGSILFYERELDAAEFFQRRAIALAKRAGQGRYEAAETDLKMILRLKQAARGNRG
jgi:hypothetical protein